MNSRFNPMIILLVFSAFTLFSCSQENSESKRKSPLKVEVKRPESREVTITPVTCTGYECLSSMDWKIYLQGQIFPDRISVRIDGNLVIDECLQKQKYHVRRGYNPEFIHLDEFRVPKNEKVKIEIYDLGMNCDREEVFISQEEEFTVKKQGETHLLEIQL